MEKEAGLCPECGSKNVKMKRSWSSVIFWAALFVIALLISQFADIGDDRLSAGLTSLAVILFIPVLLFAISAKWGVNRCKDCGHSWG